MSGIASWMSDHVTVDTGVGVSNLKASFYEEIFVPANTPGGAKLVYNLIRNFDF